MELFVIACGIGFSVLSASVLAYVSMATMIGPWIAPTLVLLSHILLSFFKQSYPEKNKKIAIIQAIGAGGGIIATGIGFAFPMLYFLDKTIFLSWLKAPSFFCIILCILTMCAGGLGLWLGRLWSTSFIDEKKLPFPVSTLTHNVITSPTHKNQSQQLLGGICGTIIVSALRDGIGKISGVIAKSFYIVPSIFGKEMPFSISPILWSIGFTVGPSITLPLFVGMISKYLVVFPLSQHGQYLPFRFFEPMPTETFTIAFCSGLVLCEIIFNIPSYMWQLIGFIKKNSNFNRQTLVQAMSSYAGAVRSERISLSQYVECLTVLVGIILLLLYFGFNPLSLTLFLLFTTLATYSICEIGGKIGMVPFGRYSTFIVVPLLLMFLLNSVQTTLVCVFFNICAATASDLLFDYKTGDLVGIDRKKMYQYQWIGLVATSISIGIILWLLFNNLGVGTEALFAQRGKAKALLLRSLNFKLVIVAMGIGFGWLIKKLRLNPTMVFGGLIMPNSITLGLITGSLGTFLTRKPDVWQPLCAGVMAAESLWILIGLCLSR